MPLQMSGRAIAVARELLSSHQTCVEGLQTRDLITFLLLGGLSQRLIAAAVMPNDFFTDIIISACFVVGSVYNLVEAFDAAATLGRSRPSVDH